MNHRSLVLASRTALVMLLIAAVVLLALGAAAALLGSPPEAGGWLRSIFGRVFARVAFAMAAVIGSPAALGLWAMVGATGVDVVPALPGVASRVVTVIAVVTLGATAIVCLSTGSGPAALDLGLIALVGLASLGLAGAASFSPHRWRAVLSAAALLLVAGGTLWVLVRAFLVLPR